MRKNWVLPIAVLLFMTAFLTADLVLPDRSFSAQENRMLAQKPEFSAKALMDGSFMRDCEDYVTDQFPGRDSFITAKTKVQRLMGKKDINGVYFAPDNTLVERHTEESVDREKAERKVGRMVSQAQKLQGLIDGSVALMLVPSADAVQPQRLPEFAEDFDQKGWIKDTAAVAQKNGVIVVDACSALLEHGTEEIYYGTDHHWTTLGAFYGYQAFLKAFGLPAAELAEYERTTVKEDFLGTLQAKVNLWVSSDRIEIFSRKGEADHRIRFVFEEKEADSFYFYERLQTRDAYAFFMDGNYPVVEIKGDGAEDRSIMLIKDSYANCFAPFLTRDYGTVWLVDLRYYRGDVIELVREYAPVDVLYLYNVFQFVENFTG